MAESEPKRSWVSSIPELGSGIAIVLSLIYSVFADLEPHFIVSVMVILAGFLIGSILYRQNANDKIYLARMARETEIERAKISSEQGKLFVEKVQAPSSTQYREADTSAKTLDKVIKMIDETLMDQSAPPNLKDGYSDLKRRILDMKRSYSLW